MRGVINAAKEVRTQVEATVLISQNPHITNEDYLGIAGRLSPRNQEYSPIFLEINGQVEEFLIKSFSLN